MHEGNSTRTLRLHGLKKVHNLHRSSIDTGDKMEPHKFLKGVIANIVFQKMEKKFRKSTNLNKQPVHTTVDLSLSHKLKIRPVLRSLLSNVRRREYCERFAHKKPIHQLNNTFRNRWKLFFRGELSGQT